jgi:glycerophosphoryl diester phosphodiesterase
VRDVLYWLAHTRYGKQAVYLDDWDPTTTPPITRLSYAELVSLKRQGVRILAPPIPALLAVTEQGQLVPSEYAKDIKRAGLDIITWSFERADLRQGAGKGGFYALYDPQSRVVKKASDMYLALDVLARDVKVVGVFSDWPATVTYYANCMGL